VRIEAHRDDTQEKAAARLDHKAVRFDVDQAVAFECTQPAEIRAKVIGKVQSVARFEIFDVELPVAHQLLDRVGADRIVLVERYAADDRQVPGIQCGVVVDQIARSWL
jgi:hypothetical protein